jgi:hypothetical protein
MALYKLLENFVKCDWPTQVFRRKNVEVENCFQLLTMVFSENFLSGRHKFSGGKIVEVENFQFLTLIFSEYFLSVDIFCL